MRATPVPQAKKLFALHDCRSCMLPEAGIARFAILVPKGLGDSREAIVSAIKNHGQVESCTPIGQQYGSG